MSKIALSANNDGTGTFTIASPGTNTNRTLTLPNATTTLVGTDATQFLSNKFFLTTTSVLAATPTGAASIEIGATRSGDGNAYLDLIGDATYTDYGTRLIRTPGSTGNTILAHKGTGNLEITSEEAAPIVFKTTNTESMRIDSAGNVGIGTTAPVSKLEISLVSAPGSSTFAGGADHLKLFAPTGSGFAEPSIKFQEVGTNVGAVIAGKNLNSGAMAIIFANRPIGSGTTTLAERMRIDPSGLITQLNATSGQGAIVGEQTFRLANNGVALGPAIADFFGGTSSISLEASSIYQITAYCVFTKTTAGTITWTMTASSAPTRMVGTYISSPNAGIGAGVTNTGFTGSQGATTAAFAVTNSLTAGANHAFQITMQVQTNAATNWKLQITNSAGTATPIANSYYTVKKISASTGTFV